VIVLDTHTLLWWCGGDDQRLSPRAQTILAEESAHGDILVSSITAWEIAMLVERQRLQLAMDVERWLQLASQVERLRFVPVDNTLAIKSVRLPGEFHRDPADRLIVALARHHSVPVVTADQKIQQYPHVKWLW
jgi:PIN domain nuclease of toxin-antitoxin system